jgi:hypothetical protein
MVIVQTTKSLSSNERSPKLREITRGHSFEIYEDEEREDFTFIELSKKIKNLKFIY